jgi:hypothetical protein
VVTPLSPARRRCDETADLAGVEGRGRSVGESDGGESTGHRSGRRIMDLLRTSKDQLSDDDAAHLRKVVGYVHRHLAQAPSE